MKNRYKFILIIFTLVFSMKNTHAQTSISISQNLSYYSNSFYNYYQLPDVNDYLGLSLNHVFDGEKIQSQIYYDGDLNLFKNYTDRLYHNQNIGYNAYTQSPDEKKIYYFGASLLWHDGQKDYDIFDYWNLEGYANAKIYFRSNCIGRFGYILNNRSYSGLSEFSYWQHYFIARINTFFQTGTSLTLDFNYGIKDYIPVQISQGMGRRMFVDYQEMPGVDQLVSSIKIAQSLGMKTSISLKYLNRFNPGLFAGTVVVVNSDALFTEDELFDDRYGYNGHELYATFTHFLPAYIKLEFGGAHLWKNYLNRQVYDLEGNLDLAGDKRADRRTYTWARISRSFNVNWGIKNIKVILNGGYLDNQSNDVYYQFDNYFGSLGLEFGIK